MSSVGSPVLPRMLTVTPIGPVPTALPPGDAFCHDVGHLAGVPSEPGAAGSDASHVTQSPLQTNVRQQSTGRIPVAAMLRLHRGRAASGTPSTMMPGNGFAGLDPCLVNYCWLACARTLFDNRILFGNPNIIRPPHGRMAPGANPKQNYEAKPIRSFVFNTKSKRKPNSNRRGDAEASAGTVPTRHDATKCYAL
jgi:hypothetical protein